MRKFKALKALSWLKGFSVRGLSESDMMRFDPGYGTRWMFFPDGNGNMLPITMNDNELMEDRGSSLAHADPDSKISLWLYYDK